MWCILYIIGIFVALIITTLIFRICGSDYDEEIVAEIIMISIIFPLSFVVMVLAFIYYLIDEFIKLILK